MRFLLSLLVVVGMVGMMYAAPKHQQNDLFCTICQKLIDEIRPFVNATDVEKIANGICDDITFGNKDLDSICKNFIDGQLDPIVDGIKDGDSSKQICVNLNAC